MNSLEEYAKDWKQIKGRQTSVDKNFLTIKNQKIMNNIIQFEKKERRENKLGITLGLGGLLLGCLFGIGLPIYLTSLTLNAVILSGVILLFSGIFYLFIMTRAERINIDQLDENSQAYLLSVKEKLKNAGRRKSIYGVSYVAFIVLGILLVYCGIFSQMSNVENIFNSSIWIPVFFGILGFVLWKIRHNRKEKMRIQPLLEEIDSLLRAIK